jgi:preprotein translocase subunit SecE
MFSKLQIFLRESYQELRKVTWPGRKEIVGSTVVVLVATAVSMGFVLLADLIIQKGVSLFLNR